MFSLNRVAFTIFALTLAALIGYFVEVAVYFVLTALALAIVTTNITNAVDYLRLDKKPYHSPGEQPQRWQEEQYKSWMEYVQWRREMLVRDINSDVAPLAIIAVMAAFVLIASQLGWATVVATVVTLILIGMVSVGAIGAIAVGTALAVALFPIQLAIIGGWLGIPAEEQERMYRYALKTTKL